MIINSFDELITIANTRESDVDKLLILQQYFLDNVEFDYIQELAFEMKKEDLYKKGLFLSVEEKEEEINKLEKTFDEKFSFNSMIELS